MRFCLVWDDDMKAQIIANFLRRPLLGGNPDITCISALDSDLSHALVFAKKYTEEIRRILNEKGEDILAITTAEYANRLSIPYILSDNPRLDFIKVANEFFHSGNEVSGIHPSAVIEKGAILGKNCRIAAHVFVSSGATIGDNVEIYPNVVISGTCEIGNNVVIKSGVVIGQSGFGFEREEDGTPIHFPHIGRVKIGNEVYIGANTAIDRSALGVTFIGNRVKIDNLVHIAHNVSIGDNSFIIAGTILGGGVHIGKNCWVAPNVAIKQQLEIGDNAFIGLGAVVIKNVEENTIVVGNPAKLINRK